MSKRNSQNCRVYCCVPQCNTFYNKEDKISFHKFPTTNKQLYKQWIDKLKIGNGATINSRVCSKHFQTSDYFFNRNLARKRYVLKRGVIPSCNLPITSTSKHASKIEAERIENRTNKALNRQKLCVSRRNLSDIPVADDVPVPVQDTENNNSDKVLKTFEQKSVEVNNVLSNN